MNQNSDAFHLVFQIFSTIIRSRKERMKGLFKVKFVSERTPGFRGQPGDAGNWDRQPWQLVVERLAKDGVIGQEP